MWVNVFKKTPKNTWIIIFHALLSMSCYKTSTKNPLVLWKFPKRQLEWTPLSHYFFVSTSSQHSQNLVKKLPANDIIFRKYFNSMKEVPVKFPSWSSAIRCRTICIFMKTFYGSVLGPYRRLVRNEFDLLCIGLASWIVGYWNKYFMRRNRWVNSSDNVDFVKRSDFNFLRVIPLLKL